MVGLMSCDSFLVLYFFNIVFMFVIVLGILVVK